MGRASATFGKKELEKKRSQKRKEKQQRKEERKAGSTGGSLSAMLAYVDENGVISNTPPDPIRRKTDASTIAVSTPRRTEEEMLPLRGRVEHFKKDKGYGFIKDINSTEKYFFHISDAFPTISENNLVSFELAKGKKGFNAVRIQVAE